MNASYPIYTGVTDCQDCYKCVRHCPVKAIRIEEGKASVISGDCILCGHCVEVCPSGAKKIRNDIERVKNLIRLKEKVFVSLAPSYISEFPGLHRSQLIRALKRLGFSEVSETALGAQEVSAHIARTLDHATPGYYLSSACPSAVELIRKHYPAFHEAVTSFQSPMQVHAGILKEIYGSDIAVVFIGPCIAKKDESDRHPDRVNAAITFKNLLDWFKQEGIDPASEPVLPEEKFVPETAREGAMYPVEGGMISGVRSECSLHDPAFMSFSGVENIQMALNGLEQFRPDRPVFIELLTCKGGCINGPARLNNGSTVIKRYAVLNQAAYPAEELPRPPRREIEETFSQTAVHMPEYSDSDITRALHLVGKYTPSDELNCGGCGYNSCRDFAIQLLNGRAEREMCVTYMRKLAQKKANALLRSIPSGVVIVNDELKIVECNRNFARLIGKDSVKVFEARPGMEGALLEKVIPFAHLFRTVLEDGEDILNKDIRYDKRILHGSVFTIEKHRIVGGVFQDITTPAMQKEHIIRKTRNVIEKNLETVQKIAYLLGENASETQVVLDSIVKSFASDIPDKNKHEKT